MNPDRPASWYLVAFVLAAGTHIALFAALPARQTPTASTHAPIEVELVAASPQEILASEPSSAPPEAVPVQPEIPQVPEAVPEPPTVEPPPAEPPAAEPPPPEIAAPQAMPLPTAAPQLVPAPAKPRVVPRKTTASATPAKQSGGAPGGPSGVVREARPDTTRNSPPNYPEIARRSGWEGRVIVRAHVSASGRVTAVSIHRGSKYGVLNQAALAAVRGWRFRPGTIGGVTADTVVEVPVNFSLRR